MTAEVEALEATIDRLESDLESAQDEIEDLRGQLWDAEYELKCRTDDLLDARAMVERLEDAQCEYCAARIARQTHRGWCLEVSHG